MQAFLGLGSNVGDRYTYIADAVASLPDVVAISPIYETDPLGGPAGQDLYLNCVVEAETELSPRDMLDTCRALEIKAGRVRRQQWEPRTLDIDILLFGTLKIDDEDLEVPHPRMWSRKFVLAPLADLAPHLVPPDWRHNAEGEVRRVTL